MLLPRATLALQQHKIQTKMCTTGSSERCGHAVSSDRTQSERASAANFHSEQSMTSCGTRGIMIALTPKKAAISSTPSLSTTMSSSAPSTRVGGASPTHEAMPHSEEAFEGTLREKCATSSMARESAARRSLYAETRSAGSSWSKKRALASASERVADLNARPRVTSHARRGHRVMKRNVIGTLPDGGTAQTRAAPAAGPPPSKYFRTYAPPNE
mmetsp:Transcript_24350/g.53173  ORF Transcript_24350/g.53173 Transcript_24350/m.53173 type:complete len:214 (+) Transcript_24350:153-794(+)|eukprot:6202120-Pleurochrysis_carterae.AAC.6